MKQKFCGNKYENPEPAVRNVPLGVKMNVEKGSADNGLSAGCRYLKAGQCAAVLPQLSRAGIHSSEYSATNAWNVNYNGNVNNNNKNNNNRASASCALATSSSMPPADSLFMQDSDGPILLEELFEAYFDCRRNKRKTCNALAFELDYEHNLIELCNDINSGRYEVGRSIAFIVTNPVRREVFAADFRDRVVHHFLIKKLNPIFERQFIADSYSCRQGKGTLYGVNRVASFIDSCTCHYTRPAYILKLDIRGFFMHIDKALLANMVCHIVEEQYFGHDKAIVLRLCNQIIFNDPTQNCIIKGNRAEWKPLPPDKSLFRVGQGKGMPIGNLTSQILANVYLDKLDKFVTLTLGFKYYGRYVDDFVIVDTDKEKLHNAIAQIRNFLSDTLELTLHPDKIYFQPASMGVKYIGAYIKPGRIYIANRTKGNCWNAVRRHNEVAKNHKPSQDEIAAFQSSINSYFGFFCHYRTARITRKVKKSFYGLWWNHVCISKGYVQMRRRRIGLQELENKN